MHTISLCLTGAAGLRISYRDATVLVDPYHTRIGKWAMLFGKAVADKDAVRRHAGNLGSQTSMVIGHTHFDHAVDVPELAKYVRGPIVGSRSLACLMAAWGMRSRVTVCDGGETEALTPDIRVTMIPSQHGRVMFGRVPYPGDITDSVNPPVKASAYRVGPVFMPKLDIGGTTILHAGSAGFVEETLNGHRADVIFLCVPGWKRMEHYPEKLLEITGARTVVLFHHHDFFRPVIPGKKTPILPGADVPGLVRRIRDFDRSVTIFDPDLYEVLVF